MASISQHIPSYVQGISEQPDELKLPGQVRDALNVLPDVTKGLLKRPGARLINPVGIIVNGKWFHIYRDSNEQYIGHILNSGEVQIFSCLDGMPRIVNYSDTPYNRYPEAPDDNDDISDSKPAYDKCDNLAFEASINAYRTAKTQLENLRRQIDDVQRRIDTVEQDSNTTEYYKTELFGGGMKLLVGAYRKEDDYFQGTYHFVYFGYPSVDTKKYEVIVDESTAKKTSKALYSPDGTRIGYETPFAYKVKLKQDIVDTEKAKLEAEKAKLEGQLSGFENNVDTARKVYELQAAACGVFTDIATKHLKSNSEVGLLPYLKHTDPADLQVLTVNDYTFITNRKVTATMSGASEDKRPYEAFVSLSQIAYNKQYALNFYSSNAAATTEVKSATRLSLQKTEWDTDDACTQTGIETFDFNHPTDPKKKNLRFTIEVRGQSVLKNPEHPDRGYECKYTASVDLVFGGEGWEKGDIIKVKMPGSRNFTVVVDDASSSFVQADLGVVRPTATPTDPNTLVTAESILDSLKKEVEKLFAFTATKIGNGLYIKGPKPFSISTPEEQLMNVFSDSVNNVARLPQQCKDGYIVKVVNSSNDEDDYYLKFKARWPGVDGEGVWEETTKPGIENTFNSYSMPHQIVRLADGSFMVSPVEWEPRLVGDDTTNPKPTFVGKTINKIVFFRNRLVMLSDENVIMSRPGDFWNFWAKTAMTVTAADVIDISVASTYPAILYNAIEVNAGLLLFSPNQQFLLTTDNDVLSPDTVKVNSISTYGFNKNTPPVSMGVTVGFLNNAGMNARFFEMVNIRREGEAEVIEQSKPVSEKLPANMNLLADSKEDNLLMCGTLGERHVWGYRYFDSGERRIQSAWFRWELTGDLVYHCIMDDVYFAVVQKHGIITLQRFDLKNTVWTAIVEDQELYPYTVHLDNYRVVLPNELQYYPHLNQTYFKLPIGYYADKKLAAYSLRWGQFQGRAAYPKIEIDSLGIWAVFEGDWSGTRLMIGYEFTMDVKFPTIYVTKSADDKSRSDTRSSLVIQRLKMNLGPVGVYETVLDRKGKPEYVALYESRPEDAYKANDVAFQAEKTQTVPVYERNTNLSVHLRSSHPSPATLYSMTWEGDYSPMYYKSA